MAEVVDVNKFKPGVTFEDGGEIFVVIEAQHSKQGRGQASVKAKVKNLRSGSTTVKTYTGGDRVNAAFIELRPHTYSYNDGTYIYLMDVETFEAREIPYARAEYELNFIKEGDTIKLRMYQDELLDIEIPVKVDLLVIDAPDANKGNTTTNPQKRIKVETGYELDAPMFIKNGDKITISSDTGKYVGKA
ncbi:elongation factor P [Mycoplasmopsis agassizii]|uniref:Elongation factor P n=1 Tax=Mycoplasmopsis agassizii TaxID=33922 RepID=A0A1W1WYC6_9BACT|nr:elongation factor P [Mycoplasmopsis agassizii]PAF55142.1 elongation factor P [Mycoplasmopsis agassizii]PAK21399.1 elongation factor P [Mycoplasmopsis agassizii]SMC16736.1 elongation factor P [Mycoplasmopsis agassizii]